MSTIVCKPLPDTSVPPKRPRNSAKTKDSVLAAATQLFASRGYADTGVREIATLAGVNSALVGRYFGTKEELFALALHESLNIAALLTGDHADFGAHAAKMFFSFDESGTPNPLTMMILAASDPAVREISITVLRKRVIAPLAEWLGDPDAEARAMQLNMLWAGFFAGWKLLSLQEIPGSHAAATEAWLAASTQTIVDRK
jgi:AcrR family transcriptional regulator